MRILVLGAGAIGGYYGGRLAAAGEDVTFLVRDARADALARDGLVVRSDLGDIAMPVKTLRAGQAASGFDAVLLSCKAYDLSAAIGALRPVAQGALVVPLLNGMRHLGELEAAFGPAHVAGGVAAVSVTLEEGGAIRHFGKERRHWHGPRQPGQAGRSARLAEALARAGFAAVDTPEIEQVMWEKFVLLGATASVACLLRGAPPAIARSPHGRQVAMAVFDECLAVAGAAGREVGETFVQTYRNRFDPDGPPANAPSMLKDLERGARVEADHIVGDMLERAVAAGIAAPVLRAAYAHLDVYQRGLGAG